MINVDVNDMVEKDRKAPHPTLAKLNDYDKENDLCVYIHCVERMGQIAAIMNVYPKGMTLQQVYESVQAQLEKYRKLVLG